MYVLEDRCTTRTNHCVLNTQSQLLQVFQFKQHEVWTFSQWWGPWQDVRTLDTVATGGGKNRQKHGIHRQTDRQTVVQHRSFHSTGQHNIWIVSGFKTVVFLPPPNPSWRNRGLRRSDLVVKPTHSNVSTNLFFFQGTEPAQTENIKHVPTDRFC